MRRRNFIFGAIGAAVGAVLPWRKAKSLRRVWVMRDGRYVRCRMYELKTDDVAKIEDHINGGEIHFVVAKPPTLRDTTTGKDWGLDAHILEDGQDPRDLMSGVYKRPIFGFERSVTHAT